MPPPHSPLARTDHLIVQNMGDEILLYDTQKDQAHVLNQTAALVWQLSNGKRTVPEITRLVARELRTEAQSELVWLALAQLSKANLLKQSDALPAHAKLTRREFLQKASIAAMVIPVVKTISAPGPQIPASCLENGASCISNAQCCSDNCHADECTCFVAGTPVLMGDGTQRAIETLNVGDQVLGRDEKTGMVAAQPVEKTYIHHNREAFTLDFGTSTLCTTATHPIYTDTGWVKTIDLRRGMDCYPENGSRLTIQNISHPRGQRQTVYNLEVGNFHTYFAGEQKVWVHNRTTIRDIPTS